MQSHTQTNIFEQSHEYFFKNTHTNIFINKTGTFFDTCDIMAHAKGKAYLAYTQFKMLWLTAVAIFWSHTRSPRIVRSVGLVACYFQQNSIFTAEFELKILILKNVAAVFLYLRLV